MTKPPKRISVTFYDFLKKASLVEKETSLEKEKPLVASVLENRLRRNQKLRYDPTIIYALKEKNLYFQNFKEGAINIRKEHFLLASSFNTYYRRGLPLTPICTPTRSSFQAALFPKKTRYLFFVAKGDESGGHYFSETYQQHKRYIQRSLQQKRKRL